MTTSSKNSLNTSVKKEKSNQIFITPRYNSNGQKKEDSSLRRIFPIDPKSSINNSVQDNKVKSCRKPIILKSNLPSAFDLERLKNIKNRNTTNQKDLSKILLYSEISQMQATHENLENIKEVCSTENDRSENITALEVQDPRYKILVMLKFIQNLKSKATCPFKSSSPSINLNLKYIQNRDKVSSLHIFNESKIKNDRNTNNPIYLRSRTRESSFSRGNNFSNLQKTESELILSKQKKTHHESFQSRNIKENYSTLDRFQSKSNVLQCQTQIKKDEDNKVEKLDKLKSFQIKVFKKKSLNLNTKKLSSLIDNPLNLISKLSLLRTNENQIKLEDCITLSLLKNDYRSRIRKVFNVSSFEILIVKVLN